MFKKKKAPKYSLAHWSWYKCPCCGKTIYECSDKTVRVRWMPCSEATPDDITVCPFCKVDFRGCINISMFSCASMYPDLPEYVAKFIGGMFGANMNCNDYFGPCADSEDMPIALFNLYRILVLVEGFKPDDALDAILQWHRGCLPIGVVRTPQPLKKLRELIGFKWCPDSQQKQEITKTDQTEELERHKRAVKQALRFLKLCRSLAKSSVAYRDGYASANSEYSAYDKQIKQIESILSAK